MSEREVVTTGGDLSCGHEVPPPGGEVSVSSTALLWVTRQATRRGVVIASALKGATVTGCPNPEDTTKGTSACARVSTVTSGTATVLRVGGEGVLREPVAGDIGRKDGATLPKVPLRPRASQSLLRTD